jgi:hypothetical protein
MGAPPQPRAVAGCVSAGCAAGTASAPGTGSAATSAPRRPCGRLERRGRPRSSRRRRQSGPGMKPRPPGSPSWARRTSRPRAPSARASGGAWGAWRCCERWLRRHSGRRGGPQRSRPRGLARKGSHLADEVLVGAVLCPGAASVAGAGRLPVAGGMVGPCFHDLATESAAPALRGPTGPTGPPSSWSRGWPWPSCLCGWCGVTSMMPQSCPLTSSRPEASALGMLGCRTSGLRTLPPAATPATSARRRAP